MVVLFHPEYNKNAVWPGVVGVINDSNTPKPHFHVDVLAGTFDEPRFIHNYGNQVFFSAIVKVIYAVYLCDKY